MRKSLRKQQIQRTVLSQGADVLSSQGHKKCEKYIQHGDTSVREHTISVACMCVNLAQKTHLKYDYSSLVRGALLHDYFQYDWHIGHPDLEGKLHGFKHPEIALKNAEKEFQLTEKQRDIISHHMFPLTLRPPKCKEAWVVTMADKYCSLLETFHMVKGIKSRLHKK